MASLPSRNRTLRQQADGTVDAIEHRDYLTSLNWRRLNSAQILDAVRCHRGVENNAHGTADVAFDEDHSPCSTTGRGIECASLLRLIAMNLCQLYRHRRHRSAAGKATTWQTLRADIFFALRLAADIDEASGPWRPTSVSAPIECRDNRDARTTALA